MDCKIVWSNEAIKDLENLVDYLKSNWLAKVLNNFSSSLSGKLQTLKKFPLSGSASNAKHFRKKLVTKHSYLLYWVKENRVEILSIIDTRQEPKQ